MTDHIDLSREPLTRAEAHAALTWFNMADFVPAATDRSARAKLRRALDTPVEGDTEPEQDWTVSDTADEHGNPRAVPAEPEQEGCACGHYDPDRPADALVTFAPVAWPGIAVLLHQARQEERERIREGLLSDGAVAAAVRCQLGLPGGARVALDTPLANGIRRHIETALATLDQQEGERDEG